MSSGGGSHHHRDELLKYLCCVDDGKMGRLDPVVICLCGGGKPSLNREGEDFRFALQIFLSQEIFYPLSGEK